MFSNGEYMNLKTTALLILIISSLFIASSCKSRTENEKENSSEVKHVYGRDDRVPVTSSHNKALNSVGAILKGSKVECTGALVGVRLVLTAEHCIPKSGQNLDLSTELYFVPQANLGPSPEDVQKMLVTDAKFGGYDGDDRANDWAILVLEHHPIDVNGNPLPFFEISDETPAAERKISLAGMSKNPNLTQAFLQYQETCTIKYAYGSEWQGILLHDCDSETGSSGGPMFTQCNNGELCIFSLQVAAMLPGKLRSPDTHFQKYLHGIANVAISHVNWTEAVREMAQNHGSN